MKIQNTLEFTADQLANELSNEYKMEARVYPLGQDVVFFGSELDCYKMAHKFQNKESKVSYSENLQTWFVSFPEWFDVDFSQKIV